MPFSNDEALAALDGDGYVGRVKTITTREFFNTPALMKSLHPGQSLVVTDNGDPSILVTKAGQRPRKSAAQIDREARMISPRSTPKVNFTTAIREMKGR